MAHPAIHSRTRRRRKPGNRIAVFDVIAYAVAIAMALLILYPFYNAVLISVVPMADYVRNPLALVPKSVVWDAYRFVLGYQAMWSGFRVTLILVLVGTLYNMVLTVMTAFALTKDWPGKRFVHTMIVITLYFSGGLVPYYLLIRDLGLMDRILSMILPTGIEFTYMVVVMRHFENIPKELEEAAEIDGASMVRTLFIVVLPLSLPILSTYALYYGVNRWNEWYNGMLFIRSTGRQPLQLVLRNLVQDSTDAALEAQTSGMIQAYEASVKMACIVLSIVPIMMLYPFLQRFFLSDLTAGAVKG